MRKLSALLFLLLSLAVHAQQLQTQSSPQPANVKYANGVSPGYALTKGTGLTLNISAGTTQCVDQLAEYAGGTRAMTDNAVNYVYLDPAATCAVAANTTGFLQGTVWLGKITTSGGAITSITDDVRTPFAVSKVAITGGGGTGGGTTSGTVALSGCGVAWTGALNFTVSPCTYNIAGTQYSSPQAPLTLAAADGTYDRIDVIAVDNTSNAIAIEGTAAPSPAEPSIDPATQLRLIAVYVPTGSSTPSGITQTDLYLENTEWTCAPSANFNCASTTNPYAGTLDIEASSAVAGNNVTLSKPSGTVDLSSYANLIFYIRSKAAWANAKSLSLVWMNGATLVGASVAVKTGACGFNSGVTTSYQQCVIPLGSFATGTNPVNKLKVAVAGGGGAIGFYLDNVSIQSGTVSGSSGPQTFSLLVSGVLSGGGTAPIGGALNVALPGDGNAGHCLIGTGVFGSCSTAAGGVTSFNLRTGAVVPVSGDYSVGLVTNAAKVQTCTNQFLAAVDNVATAGNCKTITSAYVDTSIAQTGVDINTSFQVTALHLPTPTLCSSGQYARGIDGSGNAAGCTAALSTPVSVANGGTGTGSTLTGLVRGSASAFTAAELSGDATTSGSNAVTVSKINGTSFAGSNGNLVKFGASNIPADSSIVAANVVTASSPGAGVAHFAGSTQAATSSPVVGSDMTNNTVTSTQMAVVNTRRNCAMIFGADNGGSALVDADIAPQGRQCFIPFAATVVEITVAGDAGTPNVIVRKNHAGSGTNLLSSALATAASGGIACSNTGGTTGLDGTTTCSSTLQNTSLSAGDYIETTSATAGGVAKRMSVFVTFTVN